MLKLVRKNGIVMDERSFLAEYAGFDPFEVDRREEETDPPVFPCGEPPAVTHRSTSLRLPSACKACNVEMHNSNPRKV